MENYKIDRFEAPGRHTSIIHRRLAQQRENHFVKKLTKAVLKPSIKKAEKEIAQKVGAEKAAEMVKTAMETDSAKKAISKTNKIGTATMIVAAAGGAAAAAPALGIGAGAAGAGGGSTAAAAAAKDAAKAAAPMLATTRVPDTKALTNTTVPTVQPFATKPKVETLTPLTDQAKEYISSTGISAPGIIEELQKLEKSKTVQTVKNIADLMPDDVKKQLRNKLKGGKASIGDIVANNPMSKELLPYNRETKELVEKASKEAVTDASKNKEPEFSFSSPWFIGGMVLAVIIALAVVFKN